MGYFSPQWFVPPVIIKFLVIREYLYALERGGGVEVLPQSSLFHLRRGLQAIPARERPLWGDGENAFAEIPEWWGQGWGLSLFLLIMTASGHTPSRTSGPLAL